jgi:hypothetical protein
MLKTLTAALLATALIAPASFAAEPVAQTGMPAATTQTTAPQTSAPKSMAPTATKSSAVGSAKHKHVARKGSRHSVTHQAHRVTKPKHQGVAHATTGKTGTKAGMSHQSSNKVGKPADGARSRA